MNHFHKITVVWGCISSAQYVFWKAVKQISKNLRNYQIVNLIYINLFCFYFSFLANFFGIWNGHWIVATKVQSINCNVYEYKNNSNIICSHIKHKLNSFMDLENFSMDLFSMDLFYFVFSSNKYFVIFASICRLWLTNHFFCCWKPV